LLSLVLEKHLPEIVPTLLHRFSSKEGYEFYKDALPSSKHHLQKHAFQHTHVISVRGLQKAGIRVGVITNADNRIRSVLESLEASVEDGDGRPLDFSTLLISDELGVEKPNAEIFKRACHLTDVSLQETLHVGDELER
jgi:HAD superfamily hydrolase (TIGR01549 family)